jgi:hypothetical protein
MYDLDDVVIICHEILHTVMTSHVDMYPFREEWTCRICDAKIICADTQEDGLVKMYDEENAIKHACAHLNCPKGMHLEVDSAFRTHFVCYCGFDADTNIGALDHDGAHVLARMQVDAIGHSDVIAQPCRDIIERVLAQTFDLGTFMRAGQEIAKAQSH